MRQTVHTLGLAAAIFSSLTLSLPAGSLAQCLPRAADYFDELSVTTCGDFTSTSAMALGTYFRAPVLEGGSYSFSTCGTSVDTQLTGFQGTTTDASIFYNDDNGPECTGLRASVDYTPNFTDYLRVNAHQYDCLAYDSGSPVVAEFVGVRQNNNLAITSSAAEMCEGDSRALTATPAPVASARPNSGDQGTFSGTGVSGTTFTAPTPSGDSQVFTVSYAFGVCGRTQDILVHAMPTPSVGPDQTVNTRTSNPLGGSAPGAGRTGTWTGPAGVTFSPSANSADAVAQNLPAGASSLLTWTIANGPCSASASLSVTTALPPSVTTGTASALNRFGFTVDGAVDPNASAVSGIVLRYGLSAASLNQSVSASPASLAGSAGNTPVSASASGLQCGTTYHYRFEATNGNGTGTGTTRQLTTSACCTTNADCSDGVFCNGAEVCGASNTCAPGAPPVVDDGIPCTADACDEANDRVVHTPNDSVCDDGAFCNGAEVCSPSTGCGPGTPPSLDDAVECTVDACDEGSDTITHTASDARCDNGRFCDGVETCHATLDCQAGTAPETDDGVACTVDECVEATDTIRHAPDHTLCDNGAFCDGAETCDATSGCQDGTPPSLDDTVACTTDTCDETADEIVHLPDDAACDDGLYCDGVETCDATTGCQAGAAPAIDDGVSCTVDACDETADAVTHTPDDGECDNGLFCDGAEACDASAGCQVSAAPCAGAMCDEGAEACVACFEDSDCDDLAFCNGRETCFEGACVAGEVPCASDVCDEVDGCPGEPVCGDGVRAGDEECDDGGLEDGDGCSSVCTLEGFPDAGVPDAGAPEGDASVEGDAGPLIVTRTFGCGCVVAGAEAGPRGAGAAGLFGGLLGAAAVFARRRRRVGDR